MKKLLLFLLCSLSWGAESYYVSTTGNDGAAGTIAAPWLTGQHAEDACTYGDTIIFMDGVYDERINVFKASNTEAPIIFKAQNKWGAIIKQGFHIRLTSVSLRDLYIKNFGGGEYDEVQGVYIRANRVSVLNCKFDSIRAPAVEASTISPGMWDTVTIDSCYMFMCNKGVAAIGRYWTITNNNIERIKWWGAGGEDTDMIRIFGYGHLIRGNYCHGTLYDETEGPCGAANCHSDHIQTYSDGGGLYNTIIENNIFEGFSRQGIMASSFNHPKSIHDIVVRNNVYISTTAWMIQFSDSCYDIEIYNNLFLNCTGGGLYFERGTTGIVKNNIFVKCADYYVDATSAVDAANNLVDSASINYVENDQDIVGEDARIADTANALYYPLTGSPAINGGLDLSATGFSTDILGVTRPRGAAWDIGPYEVLLANTICRIKLRR